MSFRRSLNRPWNDARRDGCEHIFELTTRLADVGEPALSVFLETSFDQRDDRRRRRRRKGGPVGVLAEDRSKAIGYRVAAECLAPGEHFVHHATERPNVGAFVHWEPAGLLRAHVGGRPDNHPILSRVERRELRQLRCRFLTDSLCQSEIQDLDGAAGRRFDVGRLQIPMNDALGVRRLECFGCLARDRQRVVQRQRPLMNAIGERCSVDEFEDQRDDVFAFFERVDGGDVGMV